jgi:hypothetical protein
MITKSFPPPAILKNVSGSCLDAWLCMTFSRA